MIHKLGNAICIAVALLLLSSGVARGGWTHVVLVPAGSSGSWAYDTTGALHVGSAKFGATAHAGVWLNGIWTDWHPSGFPAAANSMIYGTTGTQHAGYCNDRAGYWNEAGTWTLLHPASGYTTSYAYCTNGALQGGSARPTGHNGEAAIWSGTPASMLSLHPSGASESVVMTMAPSGMILGGEAGFADIRHPTIWVRGGSVWTRVDLYPASSNGDGYVFGTTETQQAGFATIGGYNRAGLWSGTAASWVDLHPAAVGANASRIRGTTGTHQVGYITIGTHAEAGMWSGTATSWVNLHEQLPSSYSSSWALSIHEAGAEIWIAGYAQGPVHADAIVWHYGPAIWGDLDGDGDVDGEDQSVLINVLLGTDTDPEHVARADLNDDGAIDGLDIQSFLNAMLGG